MELNYNFLNIIILFGGLQGLLLCVSIYNKRNINKASVSMFILFLFSLAFANLIYALLDLNAFQHYKPLHLFPFPYKLLIGPAFYFYIKNQFVDINKKPFHKEEWFLFLPAVIYGCVRLYWFTISVSENSYRLTQAIVDTNFFRINEGVYLIYTIVLGIAALKFLMKKKDVISNQQKIVIAVRWLKGFVILFIIIYVINFLLFSIDLIIHDGQESLLFLYPVLIIYVAFIYWIGIIGFIKPKLLFNIFKIENKAKLDGVKSKINDKLNTVIHQEEVYKNPNLTLEQLALSIEISPRELSNYINEVHQMNFSEYLNFHRVEKVKKLLISSESKKYTFITLAEEAGFSSKSSFNAIFKKMVGVTPSTYKKQHSTEK